MDLFNVFRERLVSLSMGQEENRQLASILTYSLRSALADARTDADFKPRFFRSVQDSTTIPAEKAWSWLSWHLNDYRQRGEFAVTTCLLAQRFLKDIPNRYVALIIPDEAMAGPGEERLPAFRRVRD